MHEQLKVDIKNLFDRFDKWFDSVKGKWEPDLDSHYARYTAVGFLVVAQAYVSVAVNSTLNDNALKLNVPLMPRTDFRTMLRIATNCMQGPSLRLNFRTALLDLLTAKDGADLKAVSWSFMPVGKAPEGPTNVTAFDWLDNLKTDPDSSEPDMIALGDRNRNRQIGGLGPKVERILRHSTRNGGGGSNSYLTPILEFRSLKTLLWAHLTDQTHDMWKAADPSHPVEYDGRPSTLGLQELEQKVRFVHEQVLSLKDVTNIQ